MGQETSIARRPGSRPISKSRRMLLITPLSLALGATACLGHHPLLGCGLSMDPAHCNLVQGPVSIGSATDPVPGSAPEHKDSVPDILKGHGETILGAVQRPPVKGPPFFISVGDTIWLRINGQIQYIDEVHWHSSDKSVATVEWVGITRGRVVGKKAGIATISVNVSGQRDSVTVTVTPDSVRH